MFLLAATNVANLGLFLAGAGVIFAGLSYLYGVQEAKRARTVDRVMRYSEPILTRLMITADTYLRLAPTSDSELATKWQNFEDEPELRHAVLATLNYYEEIAALYNLRYLNRRLTRHLLWPTAGEEYRRAEWFIVKRRNEDSPGCFTEWQRMVESLRSDQTTDATEA